MSEIESAVCGKIMGRANVGRRKYGVGVDRTDLSRQQWLQHLQEELMDGAVYVERIMRESPYPCGECERLREMNTELAKEANALRAEQAECRRVMEKHAKDIDDLIDSPVFRNVSTDDAKLLGVVANRLRRDARASSPPEPEKPEEVIVTDPDQFGPVTLQPSPEKQGFDAVCESCGGTGYRVGAERQRKPEPEKQAEAPVAAVYRPNEVDPKAEFERLKREPEKQGEEPKPEKLGIGGVYGEKQAEADTVRQTELRKIVERLEKDMRCNCDLDNWEPEQSTGHSWVCRIHRAALAEHERKGR